MKKSIYLFVLCNLFYISYAQVRNEALSLRPHKVDEASHPNIVYMDADKVYNLPADGAFLYSSLEGETGIVSSGYSNNEDHIVTIKNTYERKISLRSQYFLCENNDVLKIYDGKDTNAVQIKSVSGILDDNFLVLSSGDYLTLRFKSDNSGTSKGYRFRLDNGPGVSSRPAPPLPNPMSCASSAASDECSSSPLICDLNGYCGNTSSSYTAGNTSGLSNFCGSIENNSWLSFVAGSTSASFAFNSAGCQDNSSGIQAVIYASTNCTSFTEVSNCESQGSASGSFTITTNVNLVVGQTYYVMIDGFAGNVCSYTVNAQAGVALGQQITGPTQVCPGYSATLGSSSTASSYSWASNPPGSYPNTQTITVTPTVTTTYTLTLGPSACTPTGTAVVKTVTVTSTLNPANITAPSPICMGTNITLASLTQGGTYSWTGPSTYTANTQNATVNNWSIANNGIYTLIINYGPGCATLPATVNLTGTPTPTINIAAAPSLTVCSGQSIVLTGSGGTGANAYTWNWNLLQTSATTQFCVSIPFVGTTCSNSPLSIPGLTAGPSATFTPSQTTQVCVTSENAAGCSGQKCVNLVVLPAAGGLTVSPTSTICPGQSTTLTVSGGSTYTWSPAGTLTSPNGATVTASPTVTTTYTVSSPGCSSTQTKTVQVVVNGTPPAIGAISGPTLICGNATGITYSVNNAASTNYTWTVPSGASITSGSGTNAINVNFGSSAGTVSVVAVGTCGVATATLNVNLSPALNLTVTPSSSSICSGSSATLTASGATNYTWSPAATLTPANGASVTASPVATTIYTVIGATGTCTGSATSTVSITSGLTMTAAANTPTVCPGSSALLSAIGATSYTWANAATLNNPTGSNVTATPVANTIYTVTGANGTCVGSATVAVGISTVGCVSTACNLAQIRSTLTAAGNIELLGMNNSCSLYFINPQFMSGPQAQAYAQTFGANLISVQSASENADLLQALSNQGYSSNVVWIGFSDALSEGNFIWYDGAPITYINWAVGEPNNAGGNENCTQIYPDGTWNDLDCGGYNSLSVIEVNLCPQVTIANVPLHCPNTNVTLNASTLLGSPSYTYTWVQAGAETFTNTSTAGNTDQITVTSTSANTFTVYSEDRYSCPKYTSITLSVTPTPTITVNSSTICLGQQTATLTAGGAVTYTWSPAATLSSANGSSVTATPAVTTSYIVNGTDINTCINTNTAVVTVVNIPTLTVSSNTTICVGGSVTLTAAGATNYTWSPVFFLSPSNGSTVTANPSASTIYTVTGSSGGCASTATVSVLVSLPPPVYIVQKNSLCDTSVLSWFNVTNVTPSLAQGNLPSGITLNATHSNGGMSTTPSMFNGSIFPTTYSVPISSTTIRNDLAGTFTFCFNQPVINPQIAFASIGQGGMPVTINTSDPYQIVWAGTNVTYVSPTSLIGEEGFTIIRFLGIHSCISLDYLGSESYCNLAFGIMDEDCQGHPQCPNKPLDLIANGATTYTWNSGATTTTITPSPTVTTSYSITGMNANGCINSSSTTVVVLPSPTVTVNNASICIGQQTATLTAGGAVTYTWSPAATLSSANGSSVTATPSVTTSYIVNGTDINTCINTNTSTVTVINLPAITVTPDATVCPNSANTLTVSGAASYTWAPNQFLNTTGSATVISTPTINTTYIITGLTGVCTATAAVTLVVSNTVVVNATTATPTICPSGSATLTATGATNYTWTPSATLNTGTGSTVTATPPANQTYTVIGATSTCTNSAQVVITVTTNPVVTIDPITPICAGETSVLTGNGASTYSWSPNTNLNTTTGISVNANPPTTTTYSVTGSSPLGCKSGTTVVVNVIPIPVITINTASVTICDGTSTSLNASGSATNSYTWSASPAGTMSGINDNPVTVSPNVNTTYTVIGTNGIFPKVCSSTQSISITVIPKTQVIMGTASPMCFGYYGLLNATGGNLYSWSPAAYLSYPTDSVTKASPLTTTVYTVTVSKNGLCPGTGTVELVVFPVPHVYAGKDTTINIDETVMLSGTGDVEVGFLSPDANALVCNFCPQVTVHPQETTCYVLQGTNEFGCANRDTVCVIITKDWDVFIPNAFTPNGDNDNDIFIPMGYGLSDIKLTIFDRWGTVIFKSNGDKIGWDGTSKGKPCQQDVYIYQAEIQTMAGYGVKRTGHVTLLPKIR